MKVAKWYAAWFVAALIAFSLFGLCRPAHAQTYHRTWNLVTAAGAGGIDTTAVGMADSSLFEPTTLYQRLYLELKPNRPCRVAISVYGAAATDTGAVVQPDTNSVMVWPWRGAQLTSAAEDSLVIREPTVNPTSVAAATYEMVYVFDDNGTAASNKKWGAPRGRIIALHSPVTGEWYWNRFTRIRLRVLSASGPVTWVARLKGTAW